MLISKPKNKFSLAKIKHNTLKLMNENNLIKDKVVVNITDNPSKYTISIYLDKLSKDNIVLTYINNFIVIDFKFKGSEFKNLNYKRTFYLKNIDITKIEKIWSPHYIHITLPKNLK